MSESMPMNLAVAFEKNAQSLSSKEAIFWGDTTWSYGRLDSLSAWVSTRLRDNFGIQPGERVGIWLKNCPEFVVSLFGILKAGGVAVPINNFLKPNEVSYILADAGVNVLLSEKAMSESLTALQAENPQLRILGIEEFPGTDSEITVRSAGSNRAQDDLAVIIYTSGTTGKPKGAMLSHGNLLHNVESCRQILEAVSHDRFVVLLPMFHSFMLCVGILLPLLVGGSIVLIKSIHPPKNLIQEIILHQGTILPAIPQFFRALASAQIPVNLPLRICVSGAAPLPVEILKEFNRRFPIPLIEGYGLSEASPVVTMNPLHGPWKAGSIGKPIPGVEVTIQDDEGRMLPPGTIGELCVRGGNVMLGYWNKPEETARALRNGWLLTGDVGYEDEEGYFHITDRKKDMLLVNGINVYPREIEEILYQFPEIKEAAVIGRHDPRKGEQPVAFVVANDGKSIDEKALIQFLKTRLADYKVPRRVVLLPCLPRNATGKVLKTALREISLPD